MRRRRQRKEKKKEEEETWNYPYRPPGVDVFKRRKESQAYKPVAEIAWNAIVQLIAIPKKKTLGAIIEQGVTPFDVLKRYLGNHVVYEEDDIDSRQNEGMIETKANPDLIYKMLTGALGIIKLVTNKVPQKVMTSYMTYEDFMNRIHVHKPYLEELFKTEAGKRYIEKVLKEFKEWLYG